MNARRSIIRMLRIAGLVSSFGIANGLGGQQPRTFDSDIPPELRATIPEVRALLDDARGKIEQGKYKEATTAQQDALKIATSKGFTPDIALARAAVASGYFRDGQFTEAIDLLHSALGGAADSSNLVLEADILVSLSVEEQMKGNSSGAAALLIKARDIATQSKNPYILSRALGELGWNQLLSGKFDEAQAAVQKALEIDQLNHYRWESLHLTYSGCVLLARHQMNQGEEMLAQAKSLSITVSDLWSYVLAERALAFAEVQRKEMGQAISRLEKIHAAKPDAIPGLANKPELLRAALSAPLIRMTVLESLASTYTAAGFPDKAVSVWSELCDSSKDLGLTLTEAEGEARIADLKRQSPNPSDALAYYSLASVLYEKLQNETQLEQVLTSESLLLIKVGRGQEALPIEARLAQAAERRHAKDAQFTAYMVMAETYQSEKDQTLAKDILQKAAALLEPDASTIDSKLVLECYGRLAVAYGSLGENINELIAQERAVYIAHLMKDTKDESDLVATIQREIDSTKLHDLAQNAFDQGHLRDSLVTSEIIYVFGGTNPGDPNWTRLMTLPFALTKQTNEPDDLKQILSRMGPMLGLARLPILDSLADYYQESSRDLPQAEGYARQSETLLTPMNDSMITLKVRSVCQLAWILARQGRTSEASEKATECMALATRTDDKESKNTANATNALVRAATNDLGAAESSLRYFLASHPDDPIFHAHLASALAASGHYPEAVKEFEAAIQLTEKQGTPEATAALYMQMGWSLNNSAAASDAEKQLASFSSARDIYRKNGNVLAEANTTFALGGYYQKHKYYKKAMDAANRGGELAKMAHNEALVARAAWLKGDISGVSGNSQGALLFHQQAFAFFKNGTDKTSAILILLAEADNQNALHNPDAAILACRDAANMSGPTTPVPTKLSIKRSLGWLYLQQGEMEKAVDAFQEERDLAQTSTDLREEGLSELALSNVYQVLGRWEDASEEVGASLRIFERINDVADENAAKAQLMNILGDRTSSIQNLDKALTLYHEAERLGYASNLKLDVLEVYLQKGLYRDAISIAESSISECAKAHNLECQAHGLITVAEAQRHAGDLKASEAALLRAHDLAMQSTDFYLHGRLLYGEANLKRSQGEYNEAAVLYENLISLVEQVRGQLDANAQRSLSETYGFIYDELIEALYSRSEGAGEGESERTAAEAFKYAEANKARQFAQSWGRTFISRMRSQLPPAIQEEERSLNQRQNRLRVDVRPDNVISSQKPLDDPPEKIEADTADFVKRLRTSYPQYAAIAYPDTVSIARLPLRQGETLVECKMTDEATFVWIVRRESGESNKLVAFYRVNEGRDWFKKKITPLRNSLLPGAPRGSRLEIEDTEWTNAQELFDALFPGLHATELLESKSIVFVPDDLLTVLPFELLSPHATDGNFPLVGIPTSYYPSAAAMNLARSADHHTEWAEAFLGIGDPVTSPNDQRYDLIRLLSNAGEHAQPALNRPVQTRGAEDLQLARIQSRGFSFERLPGTASELQGIAAIFKDRKEIVETRLGFDATKGKLLETDLARFRYLHFATHGILPTDRGIEEPALVLSFDGSAPEHMLLSMTDVLGLKIRADSVVLSACNTGSGAVSRAEGVMSLGRAFLVAGASSVTVSLWQVSDESTVLFMEEYYRGLLAGERKEQALSSARLALFKGGYKDPYFWAPFILIGE